MKDASRPRDGRTGAPQAHGKRPEATVTYFKPDKLKAGGEYVTVTVNISDVDAVERTLVTECGLRIPINDIYGITSAST